MDNNGRTIAATELVLLFPAALFMTAVVVRHLRPLQDKPARTAQRIVMWYSGRGWTLWILLIALPLAVLVIGCVTLLQSWSDDAESRQIVRQPSAAIRAAVAARIVAATTLIAGVILALVMLHMLAN